MEGKGGEDELPPSSSPVFLGSQFFFRCHHALFAPFPLTSSPSLCCCPCLRPTPGRPGAGEGGPPRALPDSGVESPETYPPLRAPRGKKCPEGAPNGFSSSKRPRPQGTDFWKLPEKL